MNPQQPTYGNGPTLPSPGPEQYDFIMNAGPNQPLRLYGGNPANTRLFIVFGGAILALILIWIFLSLLSKATSINTTPILALAEQQNELSRISTDPSQRAFSQATQNFAITTELGLITDQQTFLSFLKKYGTNPSPQTLASTANPKTDNTLKEAQTTGSYDQTYLAIAQSQLNSYEQALKQAYATAKNSNEKKMLNIAYAHAQLLIQQSNRIQQQ